MAQSKACSSSLTSPYVGAGDGFRRQDGQRRHEVPVLACRACPIVKHVTCCAAVGKHAKKFEVDRKRAKYPVFVKPANLGSSVGISKAHDSAELEPRWTRRQVRSQVVIEQGVGGKKDKAARD